MIGPTSNSLDIAEHTRAQIARDMMQRKPDPVRDEFCEAVDSIHGAAWIVVATLARLRDEGEG